VWNRIYEIHVHVSRYIFYKQIELIERRLIDKVKVDHPEENEVFYCSYIKDIKPAHKCRFSVQYFYCVQAGRFTNVAQWW
jgi:hypothetical protein